MRHSAIPLIALTAALCAAGPAVAGYGRCTAMAGEAEGRRVDVTLEVGKTGATEGGEMSWRDRAGPGQPWFSVTYDLRDGRLGKATRAEAGATLARPAGLTAKRLRVIGTAGRDAWRSPSLPIVEGRAQDTYILSLPRSARVLSEPATLAVAFVGERGEILLRRSFETAPPERDALFRQALAAATAKARAAAPCDTLVETAP